MKRTFNYRDFASVTRLTAPGVSTFRAGIEVKDCCTPSTPFEAAIPFSSAVTMSLLTFRAPVDYTAQQGLWLCDAHVSKKGLTLSFQMLSKTFSRIINPRPQS